MFLITHSVASLATLKISSNPAILFIINFLLHYVLDAIPHGDWKFVKGFKNWTTNYIILFLFDMFFVCLIYAFYVLQNPHNTINALFAILGSILPDILWGLWSITKLKFLLIFEKIDSFAHQLLGVQEEQKIYFLTQVLIIGIAIVIIY